MPSSKVSVSLVPPSPAGATSRKPSKYFRLERLRFFEQLGLQYAHDHLAGAAPVPPAGSAPGSFSLPPAFPDSDGVPSSPFAGGSPSAFPSRSCAALPRLLKPPIGMAPPGPRRRPQARGCMRAADGDSRGACAPKRRGASERGQATDRRQLSSTKRGREGGRGRVE